MQRNSAYLSAAIAAFGVLLACGVVATARAAEPEISFILHTLKEENVEGPDVERNYFMAAGRKIVVGTPPGARFRVSDTGFLLEPTGEDITGEIHVSRSAFTPAIDLAKGALTYRETAAKGIPKGATSVEVQQPTLDSYPYNGWKSIGFTWTYSAYGRAMVRDVSFINLDVGVQVMVTTVATKKSADRVKKLAQEFLSSWWVKE